MELSVGKLVAQSFGPLVVEMVGGSVGRSVARSVALSVALSVAVSVTVSVAVSVVVSGWGIDRPCANFELNWSL